MRRCGGGGEHKRVLEQESLRGHSHHGRAHDGRRTGQNRRGEHREAPAGALRATAGARALGVGGRDAHVGGGGSGVAHHEESTACSGEERGGERARGKGGGLDARRGWVGAREALKMSESLAI